MPIDIIISLKEVQNGVLAMNSIDQNYAHTVLLPAVLFISSLPKNCTSIRIKIFNRLNLTRNNTNHFNLIYTKLQIQNAFSRKKSILMRKICLEGYLLLLTCKFQDPMFLNFCLFSAHYIR